MLDPDQPALVPLNLQAALLRLIRLALDALLEQFAQGSGRWDQGWMTEVISSVLSKAMALELSPCLLAALHQERFVVLRLPAGVVYNVFETAFQWASLGGPIPCYLIIDEVREIGTGTRL